MAEPDTMYCYNNVCDGQDATAAHGVYEEDCRTATVRSLGSALNRYQYQHNHPAADEDALAAPTDLIPISRARCTGVPEDKLATASSEAHVNPNWSYTGSQ